MDEAIVGVLADSKYRADGNNTRNAPMVGGGKTWKRDALGC